MADFFNKGLLGVCDPSRLDHIANASGSKPKISLRDADPAGQTPMLKPLAPDDDLEAGKYTVQGELGRGGVGAVDMGHGAASSRKPACSCCRRRSTPPYSYGSAIRGR